MAFVPKEWKARLVEFAGRRTLTNVSTGETAVYDVARNEGAVSQEGDAFSAANMNDLETRISTEFGEINKNMGGLSFGKDGDGNYGYYGADGSLIPFKSGPKLVARINALSTNTTSGESFEVDCSGINGYKSLTVTSFLFVPITTRVYYNAANFGGTYTSTKEDLNPENLAYDGITGILTGTYAYTNANQSSSGRAGGFKVMAYEVYISGIGSSNTGGSDECNHILQEKTVTPSDVVQEIVADSNYYGLSKVVVEASGVIDEIPTAQGRKF